MRRSPLILLLLLSLFAWAPLLAPGYFLRAHDAAHSLFWLVEFDQGIRDGFLWPRWAPDHALGYGYPLFTFYAPMAFYLAEIFHLLGASIVTSVKIIWALGFVLSGVTMYAFVRRLWGEAAGLVAGLLYIYAPYHLVNIYVRAALAEFVALALFPWVLLSFWELLDKGGDMRSAAGRRRVGMAALSFGLTLLTHSVTVIFFPPFLVGLVLYWLLLAWHRERRLPWRRSVQALLAGVLGVALAAIFILPALAEGSYIVQEQWLPSTYRYANQYLYFFQFFDPAWGFGHALPGPDDGMSMQVGLWLVLLGMAAALLLRRGLQQRTVAAGFVLLGAAALFMTLAASRPLWDAFYPVALIQFPFRLLALVDLSLAIVGGGVVAALARGQNNASHPQASSGIPPLVLALALAVVLGSYAYTRPQHTPVTERNQSPQAVIDFEVAYPDMRGSTAFAASPPADSPKRQAYLDGSPLPLAGIIRGQGTVVPLHHGGGSERVQVRAKTAVTLQFYTYWYPGWRATVNGRPAAIRPEGPDALITLDLPPGEHEVAIRFANTPLRTVAAAVTLLTALTLVLLLLLPQGPRSRQQAS
ncbi:MAG: hypothetical protein D6775_03455 [Caldilineae bacterium]|nr:MAG: hypothetical protein D6775_03455 [Caldilineae bacterium]